MGHNKYISKGPMKTTAFLLLATVFGGLIIGNNIGTDLADKLETTQTTRQAQICQVAPNYCD